MKAKGTGKLLMYGDDTWLKLFPGTFDRAEGTTSFFVSVSTLHAEEGNRRLTTAGLYRGGQQCHPAYCRRA
jgi:ethanolaminephosphotransferase